MCVLVAATLLAAFPTGILALGMGSRARLDILAGRRSRARVTLTIDITPTKSSFSADVWGAVRFQGGLCHFASCAYRVHPGITFRFVEKPLSAKHPFERWVLPNGKRIKAHTVRVRVTGPEAIAATFK